MSEIISGWAMHCHHKVMIEWCYDFNGRVEYIKKHKFKSEVRTRLKCFFMLPPEAVAEIPEDIMVVGKKYLAAWAKYQAAEEKYQAAEEKYQAAWEKYQAEKCQAAEEKYQAEKYLAAEEKYQAAWAKYQAAWKKYQAAWKKYQAAWKKWPQEEQRAFHDKWCGCKAWNGKTLVFERGGDDEREA